MSSGTVVGDAGGFAAGGGPRAAAGLGAGAGAGSGASPPCLQWRMRWAHWCGTELPGSRSPMARNFASASPFRFPLITLWSRSPAPFFCTQAASAASRSAGARRGLRDRSRAPAGFSRKGSRRFMRAAWAPAAGSGPWRMISSSWLSAVRFPSTWLRVAASMPCRSTNWSKAAITGSGAACGGGALGAGAAGGRYWAGACRCAPHMAGPESGAVCNSDTPGP
mmetsp:Transcript_35117/g.76882  ORF Transcript_35117/g.76882 Transcript_35117/m.76882 type:complete len:222 (-) Transcript_35117:2-667(-)